MSETPKYFEERKKVMLGNLPDDFLRVNSINPGNVQSTAGPQRAEDSLHSGNVQYQNAMQLTICIAQAQLVKNYSLTKMDPYVRLRIGHSVFETQSDIRAGKFPNWQKTITSFLPPGIKTLHIEIFDERTITPDERIAYTDFVIPEEAFEGKFVDTWVPLSGKQGADKEGSINITLHLRAAPYFPTVVAPPVGWMLPPTTVGGIPGYMPGQPVPMAYPYIQQPMHNPNYGYAISQAQPQPQPYRASEDDVKQIKEMFPDFDSEVIVGVLENCRGNKDQAITSLLTMSDK